jgi:hypothetical protein
MPDVRSIEFRLPAFIVGLVFLAVVTFSAATYRQFRSELTDLTVARLETAA